MIQLLVSVSVNPYYFFIFFFDLFVFHWTIWQACFIVFQFIPSFVNWLAILNGDIILL